VAYQYSNGNVDRYPVRECSSQANCHLYPTAAADIDPHPFTIFYKDTHALTNLHIDPYTLAIVNSHLNPIANTHSDPDSFTISDPNPNPNDRTIADQHQKTDQDALILATKRWQDHSAHVWVRYFNSYSIPPADENVLSESVLSLRNEAKEHLVRDINR
jgi:hypothetical protein